MFVISDKPVRAHKYNAKKTIVDGIVFDSKHEAERWQTLQLLEKQKKIHGLERQIPIPLVVNGKKICTLRIDFRYFEVINGVAVPTVDDAKGYRTPEYKLKKKLFEAIYPNIRFVES